MLQASRIATMFCIVIRVYGVSKCFFSKCRVSKRYCSCASAAQNPRDEFPGTSPQLPRWRRDCRCPPPPADRRADETPSYELPSAKGMDTARASRDSRRSPPTRTFFVGAPPHSKATNPSYMTRSHRAARPNIDQC